MVELYYPLHTPGAENIFPYLKNINCVPYDVKNYSSIEGKDIDILIANTRLKINQETINRFPTVKTFATISTGVDHVNFDDLKKSGKSFINSPGANASSVAEYCIASLLHFFSLEELKKEMVGLIGYGHTGRCLTRYLKGQGILYKKYDPLYPEESDSLANVLECSIVSFHVSLITKGETKTTGLVDEKYYKKMNHLKMIMNTSRGEIFTPDVLHSILTNGKLYKVLDVFSPEPINGDLANKFLTANNLLITPHIAGYSQFGRVFGTYTLAQKIAAKYDKIKIPAIENFLIKNLEFKTENFILAESSALKNALNKKDFQYFENRRNSYPPREDRQITLCTNSSISSDRD